jgi:hypothetical protein
VETLHLFFHFDQSLYGYTAVPSGGKTYTRILEEFRPRPAGIAARTGHKPGPSIGRISMALLLHFCRRARNSDFDGQNPEQPDSIELQKYFAGA